MPPGWRSNAIYLAFSPLTFTPLPAGRSTPRLSLIPTRYDDLPDSSGRYQFANAGRIDADDYRSYIEVVIDTVSPSSIYY